MSTGLNSMAAVALEDFYKTWFSRQLSPRQTDILMKTVVVVVGTVCVGLVFVVEKLGTVLQVRTFHNSIAWLWNHIHFLTKSFSLSLQMSMSLSGVSHGASLGIFSMGLFLPWVNSKVSSKLKTSLRNV
jgi:Na+/proline symporter